jgi:alkanesulfonate monooxygenase SsuD/methylene tetrahydromethanopterin reductase-like flavin-dependent oxidoreductase (luciferase family)
MLEEFCLYGTPTQVRSKVERFHKKGADVVVLAPSFTADFEEIENLIDTFG